MWTACSYVRSYAHLNILHTLDHALLVYFSACSTSDSHNFWESCLHLHYVLNVSLCFQVLTHLVGMWLLLVTSMLMMKSMVWISGCWIQQLWRLMKNKLSSLFSPSYKVRVICRPICGYIFLYVRYVIQTMYAVVCSVSFCMCLHNW